MNNNILLIDDDDLNNCLNVLVLKGITTGDNITAFNNCHDVLDYLSAQREINGLPQVIFVDYNLPELSGLEFAEKIRELYPFIKIIILTAYISSLECKEILKNKSVDDVIIKPLSEEKIIASFKKIDFIALYSTLK